VAFVPAALAAGVTPQQIQRDYALHGKLTQTYSRSDLHKAQRDAALQGYPHVGVQGAVAKALGAQSVTPTNGGLPFTGLDLTLMAVGGGLLLASGVALRRVGRAKK
jgi:hypothetical protein